MSAAWRSISYRSSFRGRTMAKRKRRPGPPTAHAPVPSLVRTLSRQGWGPLHGRAMKGRANVLRALSDAVVDDETGDGKATLWQLAQHAGMSMRHARRCLNTLEDLGLVVWWRGGMLAGRSIPSRFRVVKTALVALIKEAWDLMAQRTREHAEAEAHRLATEGPRQTKRLTHRRHIENKTEGQKPRSEHEDVMSHLHTSKEGGDTPPPSEKFIPLPDTHPQDVQRINEAAIAAHERVVKPWLFEMRDEGALLATASGGGGGSAPSRDVLAQTAPTLAKLLKRNGGKRLGRGRFQGV